MSARYVMAIDQGTTSTRCMIFDRQGRVVALSQSEHRQKFPHSGWVEHDASEIWRNVCRTMAGALRRSGLAARQIAALGIANQRETTVLWDRHTGIPVGPAIVWQDTRTEPLVTELSGRRESARISRLCGLPIAAYFAAPRIRWMLDTQPGLRERAERGDVLFVTMESWLMWNLTGGVDGGRHVTDVTNAGRTMLMCLDTLNWHDELLRFFDIPAAMLPEIRSNGEYFGTTVSTPADIPIYAALGDQQAALFGQTCFSPGDTKCTYGTGGFLLMNTGTEPVHSSHGLLTTVGFKIGDAPARYALEGSIAVTGSLVQWVRDQIGIISATPEVETLARTVPDSGGCVVVPAFSGLFAPRWRAEARGIITGLTSYIHRGHLARAVLDATAWQTREVVDAMNADFSGPLMRPMTQLRVDGGMTSNNLLMQLISDALGVPVVRPLVSESVARGAAYAAGLAAGFWPDMQGLRSNWHRAGQWNPAVDDDAREAAYQQWRHAVALTYSEG
ncbi:MAG: glycerol kinase GlpK [Rhodococcus sp.]|nr:glycerol kinase GlpK [Rhodococcus sp. (in: high G+C Gram-positive bacteria)]